MATRPECVDPADNGLGLIFPLSEDAASTTFASHDPQHSRAFLLRDGDIDMRLFRLLIEQIDEE
jgi:hypothetical protein